MRFTGNFFKVFGSLLCGLYAIVSIYAVSCALHCTFEQDPSSVNSLSHHQHNEEGHSHHHHESGHDNQHNKHKEPGSGKSQLCKFLHKVSSPAVTVTQFNISVLSHTSQQIYYSSIVPFLLFEKSNPIRAPPVFLS